MLCLWWEKEDIRNRFEDFVHPSITCSQHCYSDFYFTLPDNPFCFPHRYAQCISSHEVRSPFCVTLSGGWAHTSLEVLWQFMIIASDSFLWMTFSTSAPFLEEETPSCCSVRSFISFPISVGHHSLLLYSLFFISDLICGLEFCSRFSFLETNLFLTFFNHVFISLFHLTFLRKIMQPYHPLSFHWNEHSTSCIMEKLI